MTETEFWQELALIGGWRIKCARGDRLQIIRTNNRECPVCAVANKRLRSSLTLEWEAGAIALGLDMRFAYDITAAADNCSEYLRLKLLTACGFTGGQ